MANTIISLRSSGESGNIPNAGTLANGELAINFADAVLYFKDADGNLGQIKSAEPSGLDGEIQFNDSGVFGSDANLIFTKATGTLETSNLTADSIASRTFIQFGDGTRQYTANAGDGGGNGDNSTSTVRANSEFFIANGVVGSFTLSSTDLIGKVNNSIVTVDGLTQIPGVQYNASANSIVFSSTPVANSLIEIRLFELVDANSVIEVRETIFVPGNSFFTLVYDEANNASNIANVAAEQSNNAIDTAQGAFDQANTALDTAQGAFDQANTDATEITITPGTFGSNTEIPIITVEANGRISNVTTTSAAGGGGDFNYVAFTFQGSATWTKPVDLKYIKVTVVGGGGGGGGARGGPPNVSRTAGGGGGGGTAIRWIPAPTIPGPVSVFVGSGGAAGPAPATNLTTTNGTIGGTSSFGPFVSASGGSGSSGFVGGAGGLGSNGNLNIGGGGAGGGGIAIASGTIAGGVGGSSTHGGGGQSRTPQLSGLTGREFGGGGSGGNSRATVGVSGGGGGAGVVIVEEFY
jgi:hypothetical protein